MTIALIQQYYRTADPGRQRELDTCLGRNLDNALIDEVHLLTEEPLDLSAFPGSDKAQQRVIAERLTFARAFAYANEYDPQGRRQWILANADICFDASLAALSGVSLDGVIFALTRHDIQPDGSLAMVVAEFAHGAQDAWVFKTPIPCARLFSNFALGVPGCDNRIAYELIAAGYKVLNPSLTIFANHLDLARQSDIFERDGHYRDARTPATPNGTAAVPPPHQFHLFPVAATNPDDHALYRLHMQHLGEQHERICRQAAQIMDQGRLLGELYEELARKAQECEGLRASLSWRVTRPLRRLQALLGRRRTAQVAQQRRHPLE